MGRARSSRILAHYFFATYVVILALCRPYLQRAWLPGVGNEAYALALDLAQTALYLLPALLLTRLAHGLLMRRAGEGALAKRHLVVCAIAVGLTLLTALAIRADCRIFEIFGFHLNGFVLNLLVTPGGIDSMGLGREGVASLLASFALLGGLLLAAMWLAQRVARPEGRAAGAFRRRLYSFGMALLLLVSVGERATYAIGETRSSGSIVAQASVFPLYVPLTARNLLLDLGLGSARDTDDGLAVDPGTSRLRYPLAPLRVAADRPAPNVVWLVGESLRSDALDREIMPATFALAQDSWRFMRHYSGGNGTRMGMFSMFYGLHGPYWFEFLEERRSPVLMDVLQQRGYQLGLFTSARFSYPEFDRTIFAKVPASELHDSADNYDATDWERGWRNDRARVSDLLAFLAARDRARPFFAFMFFESTHYRYYFPDESVIRTPYAHDLDLDDLASRENAELSHARYVNAAHHLDSQIGRILDALRADGRLGDTIVLITGDHGEEFYEKGRKGHNSEFHEEQIHVPLVLWIPGDGGHVVERTTRHVDIVPTLLPLLGVENPSGDYALGDDLRGATGHAFTVVADWSRIGLGVAASKLTLPLSGAGLLERSELTGPDDEPLADPGAAYRAALPELKRALSELHRFRS